MVPLHTLIGMNPEVRYPKWLDSHPLTSKGLNMNSSVRPQHILLRALQAYRHTPLAVFFRDGMSSMRRYPPIVNPHKTARNREDIVLPVNVKPVSYPPMHVSIRVEIGSRVAGVRQLRQGFLRRPIHLSNQPRGVARGCPLTLPRTTAMAF